MISPLSIAKNVSRSVGNFASGFVGEYSRIMGRRQQLTNDAQRVARSAQHLIKSGQEAKETIKGSLNRAVEHHESSRIWPYAVGLSLPLVPGVLLGVPALQSHFEKKRAKREFEEVASNTLPKINTAIENYNTNKPPAVLPQTEASKLLQSSIDLRAYLSKRVPDSVTRDLTSNQLSALVMAQDDFTTWANNPDNKDLAARLKPYRTPLFTFDSNEDPQLLIRNNATPEAILDASLQRWQDGQAALEWQINNPPPKP